MSNGASSSSSAGTELDPLSCLPKKSIKLASLTDEVYLANKDGESLSENFKHFTSLEVVWFNNNRLSRLDNLEPCFRIQEICIQNNRIVSLAFLRSFKFIRTLLASNNQIRNLDKQLTLLTRCSFLKKLDLFDNPVAEEPDYRLRMIYHCPQVEILDRLGVTLAQRQRADEVVPNMDKVAAPPPVKALKKAFTLSSVERECFRTAKDINNRRLQAEEEGLRSQSFTKHMSEHTPIPKNRLFREMSDRWSSPAKLIAREESTPTPWEKRDMQVEIESLAGKEELNKEDVTELARQLHEEGIENVGRVLCRQDVFAPMPVSPRESQMNWKSRRKEQASNGSTKLHPLETLMMDADATMPAKEVVNFLLSLDWRRPSDEHLDRRIHEHYTNAKFAQMQGDEEALVKFRDAAVRLDGVKTRKYEVGLVKKPDGGVLRKSRSDVFTQTLLRPHKIVDEATGKTMLQVAQGGRSTKICDHR